MIIPTFHAFGPKADTANAFLGGQRLQVQRESIAAEAAQAAARIQLGRETLQQRAVEAELEAKTRQEIAARQALKSAQDAEIEKSYNLTKLGMDERKLQADEAETAMRLKQAAQGFDQRQNYERRRAQLVPTLGEEKASAVAMREFGFGEGGFGTSMINDAKAPAMDPSTKVEAAMLQQSIGEKRREILSLGDRGSSKEKKAILENQIANDTISLKRLLRPPANAPTVAPAAPQQPLQGFDGVMRPMQMTPPMERRQAPGTIIMGTPPPALEPPRSGSKTNRVGRFNVISDL